MPTRRSLLALPFLTPGFASAQASPPVVVASFSILADMVRQIAGQSVDVRAIAGPDVDSHHFQPRPTDLERMRGARLLVRNGLGFDGWFDRMARAVGGAAPPMVTATEGITPRLMDAHAHGHGHGHGHGHAHAHGHGHRHGHGGRGAGRVPDPHAWQDVSLAQTYARNIGRGLAAADPGRAAEHLAGAEAYARRLAALDSWVLNQIATVPPERRRVITTHDAFGYFGAAYGVTFLAALGVSAGAEPSAQGVARLIRQIRSENITAVFIENAGGQAVLERIAREAGVRVQGRLYADALSAPDGPAPSYEAMMRHNVGLMVAAMRGGA